MSNFFIFQTSTYCRPLDLESPADIYRYRAIPCTPQGDFVATIETAKRAKDILPNLKGMTVEEAKSFIERETYELL